MKQKAGSAPRLNAPKRQPLGDYLDLNWAIFGILLALFLAIVAVCGAIASNLYLI